MNRIPILPTKRENSWSETASTYRQSLHESLFPKDPTWIPIVGGVTSASVSGSYIPMGRYYSFAISIEGPTSSTSGYIDLPFPVSQLSVFNVAVSGLNQAATINNGESRLYLPDWTGAGRVFISGTAIS